MAGFRGYKRSIVLDFDYNQVKRGIPDVNRQMALLNAEYRKAQAEVGKAGSGFTKLQLEQEKLTTTTKLQADKVEILKKELTKLTESETKNQKAIENKMIDLKKAETQYAKTTERLEEVNKELAKQEQELGTIKGRWNDFMEEVRTANPDFDKVAGSLAKTSAAVMAIGMAGAKTSMDFDKSFGQVRALADETQVTIHDLREETLRLSRDINIGANDLGEALGKVLSSNIETADSMNVLTDAGKLAKAGNAEVTATVDVLTGAINAYGLEVSSTKELSDKLLITTKLGKMELNDLGDGFGRVAGLAATAGVPIEEVYAALASLTTGGMNTSEAITTLNSMLSNIVKPSKQVADNAKALGVNFSLTGLQSKGLAGFLKDLSRRTGESEEKMLGLFGNSKAVTGALRLAGEGAELFEQALDEMNSAAGTTEEMLEKVKDSTGERWSKAMNEMRVSLIKIGDVISPVVEFLAKLIGFLAKIPAEGWLAIGVFLVMKQTFTLISMALPILAANSTLASSALTALGIAGGLSSSQILLIAAAIALLVGLIALLVGRAKQAKQEMNDMAKSTQGMIDSTMEDAQKKVNNTSKRAYAIGTNYAEGGYATVGEHGRERMYVPRGSKVVDSATTAYMEEQEQRAADASSKEIADKLDRLTDVVMGIRQEVYSMPQRQQQLNRMGVVRG